MDFGIILKTLGLILLAEATLMLPSFGIALYYGEQDGVAFLISIGLTALAGVFAYGYRPAKGVIKYREGFMIVGLGWLLVSIFGALPFIFAGTFESFVDAFFEATSGFTTTGATVLVDIESQPHGVLFWRSFTHWLGGMGILVFTLAVLPAIGMGMGAIQIFKAESPGPTPGKLVPKVAETAKILYSIYILITVVQIVVLKIAGMSLFESFTHAFATLGTGGFSTRNASVGAFNSPMYEWIIVVFMLMAGVNFSLYYDAIHGNFKTLFKDREFRFYIGITILAILLITYNINTTLYDSWGLSIRYSSFQVVSLLTTTGFGTLDYEIWPVFSKMILFMLMFIGGCSGSTGGAIKHIRILLVFKFVKRELSRLIHPRAVIPIKVGDKVVSEEVIQSVMGFILLYLLLFVFVTIILLTQGMDLLSGTSAVAATLGNIGPGFGAVGPAMNYADLTTLTKILLSVCMIFGRLEIYTVLIILVPAFWKD